MSDETQTIIAGDPINGTYQINPNTGEITPPYNLDFMEIVYGIPTEPSGETVEFKLKLNDSDN